MGHRSLAQFPFGLRALAAGVVLCAFVAGAGAAAAAVPLPSQTLFLDYAESAESVRGLSLDITPRAEPFAREPDWSGRHVCRGVITSAFRGVRPQNAPPSPAINLPFAWDYAQGKIYLDLNRNGNLTDDAVFSTRPESGAYSYQSFTNLHLALNPTAQSHPVAVDLGLYGYSGKDISGATLRLHSYWKGKAVLGGREYQVGLVEHPNHVGSTEEAYLLLRRWEERDRPFSTYDGLCSAVEYCTNLFTCGQAYHLECGFVPGEPARFRLELTETQAELGELELTGKFIQRAVLREHRVAVPYTVVLDWPEPKVKVPVGTYNKYWAVLKEKETQAFSYYGDWLNPPPVTISPGKPTVLRMGGPLTNSLAVTKHGRTLSFQYELKGEGGRYRLAGPVDQSNPPQVVISQHGKPVGEGRFQYG